MPSRGYQNKYIGQEAEQRVAEKLSKRGKTKLLSGKNGEPDILFTDRSLRTFGVEVKSSKAITKNRIGSISITRTEWKNIKKWCDDQLTVCRPLVLVEFRIRGREYLYFTISDIIVNRHLEKKRGGLHWTLWQVIRNGIKMEV